MATVTETEDIQKILNQGRADQVPDALNLIDFGDMLEAVEEEIDKSDAVAVITLGDDTALDAAKGRGALMVQSVEVLTGSAAAGSRIVVPSTDAASATEVVLSADGTTLTFEANVGTVQVRWIPAPKVALSTKFAPTS
jgi:hypothetical protein